MSEAAVGPGTIRIMRRAPPASAPAGGTSGNNSTDDANNSSSNEKADGSRLAANASASSASSSSSEQPSPNLAPGASNSDNSEGSTPNNLSKRIPPERPSDRRHLTMQEREAAYQAARARIFGSSSTSSDSESATNTSSPSGAGQGAGLAKGSAEISNSPNNSTGEGSRNVPGKTFRSRRRHNNHQNNYQHNPYHSQTYGYHYNQAHQNPHLYPYNQRGLGGTFNSPTQSTLSSPDRSTPDRHTPSPWALPTGTNGPLSGPLPGAGLPFPSPWLGSAYGPPPPSASPQDQFQMLAPTLAGMNISHHSPGSGSGPGPYLSASHSQVPGQVQSQGQSVRAQDFPASAHSPGYAVASPPVSVPPQVGFPSANKSGPSLVPEMGAVPGMKPAVGTAAGASLMPVVGPRAGAVPPLPPEELDPATTTCRAAWTWSMPPNSAGYSNANASPAATSHPAWASTSRRSGYSLSPAPGARFPQPISQPPISMGFTGPVGTPDTVRSGNPLSVPGVRPSPPLNPPTLVAEYPRSQPQSRPSRGLEESSTGASEAPGAAGNSMIPFHRDGFPGPGISSSERIDSARGSSPHSASCSPSDPQDVQGKSRPNAYPNSANEDPAAPPVALDQSSFPPLGNALPSAHPKTSVWGDRQEKSDQGGNPESRADDLTGEHQSESKDSSNLEGMVTPQAANGATTGGTAAVTKGTSTSSSNSTLSIAQAEVRPSVRSAWSRGPVPQGEAEGKANPALASLPPRPDWVLAALQKKTNPANPTRSSRGPAKYSTPTAPMVKVDGDAHAVGRTGDRKEFS